MMQMDADTVLPLSWLRPYNIVHNCIYSLPFFVHLSLSNNQSELKNAA